MFIWQHQPYDFSYYVSLFGLLIDWFASFKILQLTSAEPPLNKA